MSWVLVGCCGLYSAYCCAFWSTAAYTLMNEHIEEKKKKKEKLKKEYKKVTRELENIENNNENIALDGSVRNYGNVVTYDYKRFLESKIDLGTAHQNKNIKLYPNYQNQETIPINRGEYL